MSSARWKSAGRAPRRLAVLVAGAAGCAAVTMATSALATTYTVSIAKSSVTNQSATTRSENVVVDSGGFVLYELSGETKTYPYCTKANGCFQFWPPATVTSAKHLTKGPGVPGQLGAWRRNGFIQLTLNGHPLYRYRADLRKHTAMGQGVKSFGGTWHVILRTS